MANSHAARRAHSTAEPAASPRPARPPGLARTPRPARSARPVPAPDRAAADRRRRARHYQLRRRDLVEDLAAGLLLAIMLFVVTAGLGIVALLEFPLVAMLLAPSVIARRRRGRSRARAKRP